MNISNTISRLSDYIIKENFRGYDPYDILNSWLPFHFTGKWGQAIAIQFQKRNPVNIRPLIGVKKGINPKAMGLLLSAYCSLYEKLREAKYKIISDKIFEWLMDNTSEGYSGNCWGYNFPWVNPGGKLEKYTPSVVVTSFVINGLFDYYQSSRAETAKNAVISSTDYLLKDLGIIDNKEGIAFPYTHLSSGICYNASLLGANILLKAYLLSRDQTLLDQAIKTVIYILSKQKADGRWNYSYNPKTGMERRQIDYHQGYILDVLFEFHCKNVMNDETLYEAIKKGAEFYRCNQFLKTGQSLWRFPKKYPVDIHNQAQGIITFTLLSELNPEYLEFARLIASWTMEHLLDIKGFFYYRRNAWFTNRISYMRWSQSWMLLALTKLFNKIT